MISTRTGVTSRLRSLWKGEDYLADGVLTEAGQPKTINTEEDYCLEHEPPTGAPGGTDGWRLARARHQKQSKNGLAKVLKVFCAGGGGALSDLWGFEYFVHLPLGLTQFTLSFMTASSLTSQT